MFQKIESQKVYYKILNQIKSSIEKGELRQGTKLPSERVMAEQMNVSRVSIREAIRSLELAGLVKCRHGEGNFISESIESSLTEPMELLFLLSNDGIREVHQLRCALEIEAVKSACAHIEKDTLEKLKDYSDAIERSDNPSEQSMWDKKFHDEVARSSRNNLIISILNSASNLIESNIKDFRQSVLKDKETSLSIQAVHRKIIESLEKGDEDGAVEAMREHMEIVLKSMEKRL